MQIYPRKILSLQGKHPDGEKFGREVPNFPICNMENMGKAALQGFCCWLIKIVAIDLKSCEQLNCKFCNKLSNYLYAVSTYI